MQLNFSHNIYHKPRAIDKKCELIPSLKKILHTESRMFLDNTPDRGLCMDVKCTITDLDLIIFINFKCPDFFSSSLSNQTWRHSQLP